MVKKTTRKSKKPTKPRSKLKNPQSQELVAVLPRTVTKGSQLIWGKAWRKLMGEVPSLMGVSWETGKPLKSGYGQPPLAVRATRATQMIGNPEAAENITRWAGRSEEHHVILMKILEPYLIGRTIDEADEIIKRVSKNLGGRPLGNKPGNLRTLIKELHRKLPLSAHGILKRYYDLQGATAYNEYDEIVTFPKLHGETVFGRNFDRWYQISGMQDGNSLDMIRNIQNMDWKKSADTLTGFLDLTIPRLEGAVLASVWLDPTSRRAGPGGVKSYAQELLETFPEGKKHLMETLTDIKHAETKAWRYTDPSRPMEGQTKVLTEQRRLHKKSQHALDAIAGLEKEGPFGIIPEPLYSAPKIDKLRKPKRAPDIPKTADQLVQEGIEKRALKYQIGIDDLNRATDNFVGGGRALAFAGADGGTIADVAVPTKAKRLAKALGRTEQFLVDSNPEAAARLADFGKPGTTLLRRGAALMPFVGAGFDAWDVKARAQEINEKLADQDDYLNSREHKLDKLQHRLAVGTLGTTWYAEPINTALGLTNVGIDFGRWVSDQENRTEAVKTMRALGTVGMHKFGQLHRAVF